MFGLLGFLPGWVTAKIMHSMGVLRIPREVELAGLDFSATYDRTRDEQAVIDAEKEAIGKG